MVIPRSLSRSIESRNCSLISRLVRAPVFSMSRSESVVLPWSMCAMIEKLRMLCMKVRGVPGRPFYPGTVSGPPAGSGTGAGDDVDDATRLGAREAGHPAKPHRHHEHQGEGHGRGPERTGHPTVRLSAPGRREQGRSEKRLESRVG